MADDFVCPSCGTVSTGKFCTACGEKKLGPDDRSLRHFFDIVANFLTHFDSKGYRSLWYLIAKPGFLSVEQLRGSRVNYARPFSLFLSINVVYYFSIALFGANTFTTPLAVQLHQNDYYAAYAARKNKDIKTLKQFISKDMFEFFEILGEGKPNPLDEGLKEFAESPQNASDECRNEKIKGDTATLEYLDEKGAWKTMDLVKEDGGWKLTIAKMDNGKKSK